jgi:hypothetical protein
VTDFETDDITAMHQQGDLKAFMRQQIATGQARRTTKPAKPPPHRMRGHKPGEWPPGTSPPEPRPPTATAAQWAQALEDFRTGHLSDRDPCECGTCPPPDKPKKPEENR